MAGVRLGPPEHRDEVRIGGQGGRFVGAQEADVQAFARASRTAVRRRHPAAGSRRDAGRSIRNPTRKDLVRRASRHGGHGPILPSAIDWLDPRCLVSLASRTSTATRAAPAFSSAPERTGARGGAGRFSCWSSRTSAAKSTPRCFRTSTWRRSSSTSASSSPCRRRATSSTSASSWSSTRSAVSSRRTPRSGSAKKTASPVRRGRSTRCGQSFTRGCRDGRAARPA